MAVQIDKNGFYIQDLPGYQGVQTKEIIIAPTPGGLWHPRWDGQKWIEGLTPEEIQSRQYVPLFVQGYDWNAIAQFFHLSPLRVVAQQTGDNTIWMLDAALVDILQYSNLWVGKEGDRVALFSSKLQAWFDALKVQNIDISSALQAAKEQLKQCGFGELADSLH